MNNPRVSILLSVFNGEKFLSHALDSLVAQTEKNCECIAINDGSTDGTGAILESFAKKDSRFRVVLSNDNKGLTYRLNEGLALAKGEYIARQDADDWSLPNRLSAQVQFLDMNPEVGLLGCAYQVVDKEGNPLSVSRPATHAYFLKNQLRHRNPLAHGSLMMRADVLKQIGGYRSEFKMAQDYDLIMRLMKRTGVAALPDILYCLRLSPHGITLRGQKSQNQYAAAAGMENLDPEKKILQVDNRGIMDQRYKCLEALHLIKTGRTKEARIRLKECTDAEVLPGARRLKIFSYLPGPIRVSVLGIKRIWEMMI